jgi:protease-4
MTVEAVDAIAQGRIWTGAEALEIGLVDEIGTLSDALAYTAGLAGDADLASWNIVSYPKELTPFQQILQQMGQKAPEEAVANLLKGTPFETIAQEIIEWQKTWVQNPQGTGLVFARMPYVIDIR